VARDPHDDGPPTKRERAPLFKTIRLKVPPDRGVAPLALAMAEADGYAIESVERRGTEAIVTLKRIDTPRRR
jgi:hypothetical protein